MFDFDKYTPQAACGLWEPWLIMLWAGSDLMIVTACTAISLAILLVMRRRADCPHRGPFAVLAAFLLLCGMAHFMGIVSLWYPIYPIEGAVKLATGIVGLATGAFLFRLIPLLVRIPPRDTNDEIIARLEVALADLSRTRDELQHRLDQRTADLEYANSQLSLTAHNAVDRSRNLLQAVSALTRQANSAQHHSAGVLRELCGRIDTLVTATSAVLERPGCSGVNLNRLIRRQIGSLIATPETRVDSDGPVIAVGVQGAQQISLVMWELCSRFTQMERSLQSRGRIAVTWSIEHDCDGEARFSLEWRERFISQIDGPVGALCAGDGTLTPAPIDEFSETLLTRIIPHLLGGKGRIRIQGGSFIYRLNCPISALDKIPEDEQPAVRSHDIAMPA